MRKDIYGLKAEPRSLLIPRQYRFDVTERVRADGSIETPLDEDQIRTLARKMVADGIEAVAVCYLHAYRNAAHEARTLEILHEEAPGLRVSLSHRVSPEMREFERTSTTVLNAVLMPVVGAYLERIERRNTRPIAVLDVLDFQMILIEFLMHVCKAPPCSRH